MVRLARVAWATQIAFALPSCGPQPSAVSVSAAGNCRILRDQTSAEYLDYLARVRRSTGCQSSKLADCPTPIKLEFVDYPPRISRAAFENPDFAKHDYARARLRTTSLVGYDLWLSRNFNLQPWNAQGYEVRYRDGLGHLLVQVAAAGMQQPPDCSNYVVLSAGNSVDIEIPLIGQGLSQLQGNLLQVRVGYSVNLKGAPKAIGDTVPVVGLAVSEPIVVTVD
jgi:hypothetical protein